MVVTRVNGLMRREDRKSGKGRYIQIEMERANNYSLSGGLPKAGGVRDVVPSVFLPNSARTDRSKPSETGISHR